MIADILYDKDKRESFRASLETMLKLIAVLEGRLNGPGMRTVSLRFIDMLQNAWDMLKISSNPVQPPKDSVCVLISEEEFEAITLFKFEEGGVSGKREVTKNLQRRFREMHQ